MPSWLEFVVLAVTYVGTGGAVFLEWGKKRHFLTGLAVVVSLGMSGYFWRDRILDGFGFYPSTEKPKEQPGSTAPPSITSSPNDTSQNEQKSYSEAIRCLYSTCESSSCMELFRRTFPSSALLPLLELTATNAQTSPACRKITPPTGVAKPSRTPDCNSKDIQQNMLPLITRWFERAVNQSNALTGHNIRTQNVHLLSVYSQFSGICNVMAIGTLVDGNRTYKLPSDGLVVELNYNSNGDLLMQTFDGVK